MNRFLSTIKTFLITNYRDPGAAFWTTAFPIFLATLLAISVGKIPDKNQLKPISIGYEENTLTSQVLKKLPFIEAKQLVGDDHIQLIEENQLVGYLNKAGEFEIIKDGLAQGVLAQIITQTDQIRSLGANARFVRPEIKWAVPSPKQVNPLILIFINILALFSFYSYFGGIALCSMVQANLSTFGQRLSLSPISKFEMISALSLAASVVNLINNLILILYIQFVLQKPVISNPFASLAILLFANFIGLSFGILVGTIAKVSENAKIMIGVSILMILSTLSGATYPALRIMIRTHAPILEKLNPVAVIFKAYAEANQPGSVAGAPPALFLLAGIGVIVFALSIQILNRRSFKTLGD
ncbi:MAG: ABC transporter permease [Eubacteriales bacterium]|nr:ABC transporter permease [Eubacteriales bacterium]